MSRLLARALLLSMITAAAQAADIFAVTPALWDRPRSARSVLDEPAVRQAIGVHLSRPDSQLLIHHGSGQDPFLQAEELRNWLMALAIEGARIRLINEAGPNESLTIEVTK